MLLLYKGAQAHTFFLVSLHCVSSCICISLSLTSFACHPGVCYHFLSGYNCYFHSCCYYFLSLLLLFPFGLLLLLLIPFAFKLLLLFFLFKLLLLLPFTLILVDIFALLLFSFTLLMLLHFVLLCCWCAFLCTLVTIINVFSHPVIKACNTLPFVFCKSRFGYWSFS